MNRKITLSFALIALLLMSLIGVASADEFEPNIVDITASNDDFDTLHTAIVAAGLADTLASADNSFTVFAPTDDAFAALEAAMPGITATLLADPEGALTQVLLYHAVAGEQDSSAVLGTSSLTTLQGEDLAVSLQDGAPYVDNSQIVVTDIQAKNGIIHVIDAVLVPDAVASALAASDDAAMDDDMAMEEADEMDSAEMDDDAMDDESADEATGQTIAEIAIANGSFDTLVAALSAAGLADTFNSPGHYTVFAPTDAAFAALEAANPGITEALLADPTGNLTTILTYHVVSDVLTRDQLATTDFVTTLEGRPLTINKDGSNITDINGATVVMYNIEASNGIIHVIDTVLVP